MVTCVTPPIHITLILSFVLQKVQMQNGANAVIQKSTGNEYFSVPGHAPVIFSEVGGRTLYRLLARDAGGETEGVLLNETVPT